EALGQRGVPGRKAVEERQRREERRWRVDELRAGLGVLGRAYGDRLAALAGATGDHGLATARLAALAGALSAVEDAAAELVRNPNEALMLQALLVRLSTVTA
ncbi:MAG: hypothetical protein ACYDB3_08430, partial [Acidimicrobiales bacterium]